MDREEGKLEAIGDTGLVVDIAQVVLDYLLLRVQLRSDVLVFAALNDKSDDLHLFRGEAVTDAFADAVLNTQGRYAGLADTAQTMGDAANGVDEFGTGDVAGDHAIQTGYDLVGKFFGSLCYENNAAAELFGLEEESGKVDIQAAGEEYDRTAIGFDGCKEAGSVVTLCYDPHIIFHGKQTSSARTENGLVVPKDNSIHGFIVSAAANAPPAHTSSAEGSKRCSMSTIRTRCFSKYGNVRNGT